MHRSQATQPVTKACMLVTTPFYILHLLRYRAVSMRLVMFLIAKLYVNSPAQSKANFEHSYHNSNIAKQFNSYLAARTRSWRSPLPAVVQETSSYTLQLPAAYSAHASSWTNKSSLCMTLRWHSDYAGSRYTSEVRLHCQSVAMGMSFLSYSP